MKESSTDIESSAYAGRRRSAGTSAAIDWRTTEKIGRASEPATKAAGSSSGYGSDGAVAQNTASAIAGQHQHRAQAAPIDQPAEQRAADRRADRDGGADQPGRAVAPPEVEHDVEGQRHPGRGERDAGEHGYQQQRPETGQGERLPVRLRCSRRSVPPATSSTGGTTNHQRISGSCGPDHRLAVQGHPGALHRPQRHVGGRPRRRRRSGRAARWWRSPPGRRPARWPGRGRGGPA